MVESAIDSGTGAGGDRHKGERERGPRGERDGGMGAKGDQNRWGSRAGEVAWSTGERRAGMRKKERSPTGESGSGATCEVREERGRHRKAASRRPG
jgi:hypothetical protein